MSSEEENYKELARRFMETRVEGDFDAIVRELHPALPDDEALTHHTDALYNGLYAYLSREVL